MGEQVGRCNICRREFDEVREDGYWPHEFNKIEAGYRVCVECADKYRLNEKEKLFKPFMELLSKEVNVMGHDFKNLEKALVNLIISNHRTLQSGMISILYNTLVRIGKLYKEDSVRYSDLRNEYAMKACAKLSEERFPLI